MTWQGKRVLVTGAGGFIGSHLTERLVELGAKTRALVHYRGNGSWGWLDESLCSHDIEVVMGDVQDRDSVAAAMKGVEVVFHLAALIGIPYSYEAPLSYLRTNIEGTLNVLEAARAGGAARVVQTSTSEVYGTAQRVPITEDHPLQAQSPYAASKIGADQLAGAFSRAFGLPVVILRPFNTFGPRQSARAVTPTIITQCLTGTRVRLGHLRATRDLNFVGNIVDGFLRAGAAPEAPGRTIHLGSGRETSITDLVRLVADQLGKSVEIEQDPTRQRPEPSEVERLVADAAVAKQVLGWAPAVSLEDGLRTTIEWMQEHLDGYRPGVYVV